MTFRLWFFLSSQHYKPKTEKLALHLDGVHTVTPELLLLWSFESDASPAGDNTENWMGWLLETGLRLQLISREMDYSACGFFISYREIWTLGPRYSEACDWHLQKPWHPTLQFTTRVRQRSILNDCQPDDKASYYRGVVSPGLKTHRGGTEACRGEDKM